jgi:hypothetical protein
VTDIGEILRRLQLDEPDRRIARDLDVSRNTVARYRVWAARYGLLEGGALPDAATLATLLEPAPSERAPHEQSLVEPWRERVLALHGRGRVAAPYQAAALMARLMGTVQESSPRPLKAPRRHHQAHNADEHRRPRAAASEAHAAARQRLQHDRLGQELAEKLPRDGGRLPQEAQPLDEPLTELRLVERRRTSGSVTRLSSSVRVCSLSLSAESVRISSIAVPSPSAWT